MLDIAGVGFFRDGTALGRRLGEVCGTVLIKTRERSTIVYSLFLIWTGRYAQALNTPAPGSFCTDVDVVK